MIRDLGNRMLNENPLGKTTKGKKNPAWYLGHMTLNPANESKKMLKVPIEILSFENYVTNVVFIFLYSWIYVAQTSLYCCTLMTSVSSLKQQSTGRHVTSFIHIIHTLSQPIPISACLAEKKKILIL